MSPQTECVKCVYLSVQKYMILLHSFLDYESIRTILIEIFCKILQTLVKEKIKKNHINK